MDSLYDAVGAFHQILQNYMVKIMKGADVCTDARFMWNGVELRNMVSPLGVAKVFTEHRPNG